MARGVEFEPLAQTGGLVWEQRFHNQQILTRKLFRRLARQNKHAAQARRLLARAAIYEVVSRSDATRLGSVTLQIVRDLVLRSNSNGPEELIDGEAAGARPLLNDVMGLRWQTPLNGSLPTANAQ